MLDQLAHQPDPYPTYAELRSRGVHQVDDGRWVVASAADVAAVLASPAVAVGFVPLPNDRDGVVQARMARFSDGAEHDRRRAIAVDRLAAIAPDRLRSSSREIALELMRSEDQVEVMSDLARAVPVAALAQELGAEPDKAVAATRELCLALAPPAGEPPGDTVPPATTLAELLRGTADGPALTEVTINVVALLFQAMDGTAGLVGNTVVAASRFGAGATSDALVAETNRFDPSVQLTNRVTTRLLEVAGVTIPAGQRVVILLAAANRDPDLFERPDEFDTRRSGSSALTFGGGGRPCPGATHALALAAGVLDAMGERQAALTEPAVTYEPRPNLRIPARLTMRLS